MSPVELVKDVIHLALGVLPRVWIVFEILQIQPVYQRQYFLGRVVEIHVAGNVKPLDRKSTRLNSSHT